MRCFSHSDKEAVGICVNCGKALCKECMTKSESGKILCSNECAISNAVFESAIDTIQVKSPKYAKATAYFLFMPGVLFLLFGMFQLFAKPEFLPLSVITILLGAAFIISGVLYMKACKKNIP